MSRLPRESEWVFTTLRGTHFTPSARNHHRHPTRATVGLAKNLDLYACTRHYWTRHAWNIMRLDPEDIAVQLGHHDTAASLVRRLCRGDRI
jgi:integrase